MDIHEQVNKEINEMYKGKRCCKDCKYVGTIEERKAKYEEIKKRPVYFDKCNPPDDHPYAHLL